MPSVCRYAASIPNHARAGTSAEAGAARGLAVAAHAGAAARGRRAAVAAGEHLDHTADGFRSVQRRARPAHDLDPVDQLQRQVLEREQAGGRRTRAHAVDQHQHVVRLGAAQEHGGELAGTALVRQRDPGAPAQQVRQVARLAALDRGAVDHLDRRQRIVDRDRGAGGGDLDPVQLGGVLVLCKHGDGQCQGQRGRKGGASTQGRGRGTVGKGGEGSRQHRARQHRHLGSPARTHPCAWVGWDREGGHACEGPRRRRRRRDALRVTISRLQGRSPGLRGGRGSAVVAAAAPSHAMHSGGCRAVPAVAGRSLTVAGAAPDWSSRDGCGRRHRLPVSTLGRTSSGHLEARAVYASERAGDSRAAAQSSRSSLANVVVTGAAAGL
jgi:hypothetical protein